MRASAAAPAARVGHPLLLIDVDGVISLFGFDPEHPPPGRFHNVDGIVHYLSAEAGRHLTRLAERFELAWCTGWEEKANEHLPEALGLPGPLPALTFGEAAPLAQGHWKLRAIDAYAGPERALAWVDDAHDERCHAWAAARPGPTLLVGTDPARGLTAEQVDRLLSWVSRLP
jgi:hypothetical protein